MDQVRSLIADQLALLKIAGPHDDTQEKMSELIQRVAEAKARGDLWVETTAENIALLQPHGLGKGRQGKPNRYFCWQGVKICQAGQTPRQTVVEIEDEESKTMHDRLHPEDSKHVKVLSGAL